MKPLSTIASAVRASTTLAVDSLAKKMRSEGLDVIGFGTGEPDFDTPDYIKEAAIRAIEAGQTKYTPAAGIPALRKAVAARLRTDCGLDYEYTQIVVASGAKTQRLYCAADASESRRRGASSGALLGHI